nr:DegV family protein [Paenibacillus sp. HB172176]
MGKVRIVTDSTSDIPVEVRRRLGIEMIPLRVLFGEEAFLDAVTIEPEQLFAKIQSSSTFPTTSQPSPVEFEEVYERLLSESPHSPIISIHLASVLSGTYQSARIASSAFEERDITVVNSCSASYGIGMLVVKAAEMAEAGSSRDEILAEIDRLRKDTQVFFLVDTLEFLQKGGRIGKASALIGSILNIKPILSLDSDGTVFPTDKVRGSKKAIGRITELLKQSFGDDPVRVILAWTDSQPPAMELGERVKAELNVQEIGYTTVGSVIGLHAGPGTSAVFVNRV